MFIRVPGACWLRRAAVMGVLVVLARPASRTSRSTELSQPGVKECSTFVVPNEQDKRRHPLKYSVPTEQIPIASVHVERSPDGPPT